jgi:hypothetical protein
VVKWTSRHKFYSNLLGSLAPKSSWHLNLPQILTYICSTQPYHITIIIIIIIITMAVLSKPVEPTGFLHLPGELRNQIYDHALSSSTSLRARLPLLYVHPQIRAELLPFVLSHGRTSRREGGHAVAG